MKSTPSFWFAVVVSLLLWAAAIAPAIASTTESGPVHPDPIVFQTPKMTDASGFEAEGVNPIFYDGLSYQGKPIASSRGLDSQKPSPVRCAGNGAGSWRRRYRLRQVGATVDEPADMPPSRWIPAGNFPSESTATGNRMSRAARQALCGSVRRSIRPATPGRTMRPPMSSSSHSLLRSMPQVDADRIGLTGISWGGYLTCIVAGMDDRFKFAAPVYGCGFLGEDSVWRDSEFKKMEPEKVARWLSLWDPSVYLPAAKMPMLWVDGTNDFAYPLDSLQKSYRLPKGPRRSARGSACLMAIPRAKRPRRFAAFADAILRDGKPLAKITGQGRTASMPGPRSTAPRRSSAPNLNFTKDEGVWQKRKWETIQPTSTPMTTKASAHFRKASAVLLEPDRRPRTDREYGTRGTEISK